MEDSPIAVVSLYDDDHLGRNAGFASFITRITLYYKTVLGGIESERNEWCFFNPAFTLGAEPPGRFCEAHSLCDELREGVLPEKMKNETYDAGLYRCFSDEFSADIAPEKGNLRL